MMRSRVLCIFLALAACICTAPSAALAQAGMPAPAFADPFYLVGSRARMAIANPPVNGNFSGITYSSTSNSVFVVDNGVSHIYEFTLAGLYRRTITTTGFEDAEGIVWMGGNQFGVLEEKNSHISLVTIAPTTTSLVKSSLPTTSIIRPDLAPNDPSFGSLNPTGENVGLEGIAFDPLLDLFYLTKEKAFGTPGDYGINVFAVERNGNASVLFNPTLVQPGATYSLANLVTDIADVHFDPVSRNLLVLSHESRRLVEVTLTGKVLSFRDQPGTQIEGLTMTPDRKQMFVVGESREFFRYEASPQLSALIPPSALWRYDDAGVNRGTVWRDLNYDASTWKLGFAELGYGDADERTIVRCGPNATCSLQNDPTKYFRHEFSVTRPDRVLELMLGIQRDDGAVVYLNGVEVYRDTSLLAGATYDQFANRLAALADPEEDFFMHLAISPTLLRAGTNVLAVEVHQFAATDLDMSFNAQLIARYEAIPEPASLSIAVAAAAAIGLCRVRRR